MAYQVYITDALVCGSKDSNTSDKSYLLFTREGGMVWAAAKSVREERSKHRYSLQDFSLIRASLVRGKSGWRITGTEPEANLYYAATTREGRTLVRNTVRFLRRFIHGETPVPAVFDDVALLLREDIQDTVAMETIVILRALFELGYIAPKPSYEPLIRATTAYDAYASLTEDSLTAGRGAVAHALDISHL